MTEIPLGYKRSLSFGDTFGRERRRRAKAEEEREREREMIPQQWTPPCGSQCTHKYAALTQIPWRVFCKKGCDADSDSWEDYCSEICYKDPVLKDRQWSAYIDRSPGAASYSEECFHACVAGCGYKHIIFFLARVCYTMQFEVGSEEVDKVKPKRPPPPPPKPQPPPRAKGPKQPPSEEVPGTSA
ncbi:hypothetical protein IGI04_001177 [Brassica rapa subsp. trilocularis]|uniref:Uncharacterized protein n=1 Tax=Brassica rapa subsp. trilocularis TaxID=1813537 RepID=A0ABQ7NRX6_BRACM|nr:hypothetical protein IGI04_001177 [Brassica rapa subsp. trilocularis]